MKKSYLIFVSVVMCLGMLFGGIPYAFSQGESEFTLEEITVTAEKRSENLQKVSMSIAVVQGEAIRDAGAVSIADILKDIPNVSTSDTGGLGSTINIRGLGQDLPIGVGESAVSTNFDGAYQMRSEANIFGYFDVDRIEVLRGPQGTLYGRNATGGVVNIISTKPRTDKVEGYAALEFGNYKKMKTEAAVNVPLSDKFAGRLAFVSTKQNGYTHDIEGGVESQEGMASRIQFRYVPNENAYLNLLYNYTQRTGRMGGEVGRTNWVKGNYDVNTYQYPYSRTNKSKSNSSKISLTAEFPLGIGVVTVLPTYEKIKGRNSSYGLGRGATEPSLSEGGMPWNNETKTAELRYANKSDSDIMWVGGLYWTDTDEPVAPRTDGTTAFKWYNTKAAFAQITNPFTDTFRLILGARYDIDKKGYEDGRIVDPYPSKADFKFSYFDWKVGVEKDLAKDIMGYFTVASGHKPGGFAEQSGIPFEMESAISAEVGLKSRFMDNRLQVNGDIFYYDYKNYQVVDSYWEINDEYPQGTMYSNFFNAPKARNIGAELETMTLIGDATTLNLNLSYLNNKYTEDFYVHAATLTPGVIIPMSNQNGKTMPHSPEFTIKGAVDHTFSFSDGSTLKPSISYRWTDDQYIGFLTIQEYFQPAFAILDISVNYASAKGWSLNFYGNNVLDEHYATGAVPQREVTYFPGSPRTMGVTFNVRF